MPPQPSRAAWGRSRLLARTHLTEESAIQVNLSKETVRLPLYRERVCRHPHAEKVWYVLLDASDSGLAMTWA